MREEGGLKNCTKPVRLTTTNPVVMLFTISSFKFCRAKRSEWASCSLVPAALNWSASLPLKNVTATKAKLFTVNEKYKLWPEISGDNINKELKHIEVQIAKSQAPSLPKTNPPKIKFTK